MDTTNISCTDSEFCLCRGDDPAAVTLFLNGHKNGVEAEWTKGNDKWDGPIVLSQALDLEKLIEDLLQNKMLAIEVASRFEGLSRGRFRQVARHLLSKHLVHRQNAEGD